MAKKSSVTAEVKELPSGWALVTAGGWEVSVGPDGLIQLPRHLAPAELPDFIVACEAAAEVGAAVIAKNAEARANTPTAVLESTLVVSADAPPKNAVRVTSTAGAPTRQSSSKIGRRV